MNIFLTEIKIKSSLYSSSVEFEFKFIESSRIELEFNFIESISSSARVSKPKKCILTRADNEFEPSRAHFYRVEFELSRFELHPYLHPLFFFILHSFYKLNINLILPLHLLSLLFFTKLYFFLNFIIYTPLVY